MQQEMEKFSGVKLETFHARLQVAIEVLRDSRLAAERLLPFATCRNGEALHLDAVFMPALKPPEAQYHCSAVTFDRSYIQSADLRAFAPSITHIDLRRTIEIVDPYYDIPYLLRRDQAPSPYVSRSTVNAYVGWWTGEAKSHGSSDRGSSVGFNRALPAIAPYLLL
jgi:hypothetical protein